MDKKKTGELIKDARTRKNYTQSELGELLGVTNKAVSRWETGESFPDIGLLESLSNVLDLKIQDIVVGEIQADDETAFTEIVRLSRLQEMAKRKKIVHFAIGIMIIIYSCLIGCNALRGSSLLGNHSGMIYLISLAVILMILLYGIKKGNFNEKSNLTEKDNVTKKDSKVNRTLLMISVISGIWIILVTCSTVIMVGNGVMPFHMDASSVGPFLNVQLIAIFLLNMAIIVTQFYKMDKRMEDTYRGIFVPISVLYLAVLYSDALHRLSEVESFYQMIFCRTIIVLAELLLIFVAAVLILKRKKRLRG
ncbi:MAG: helix-turn-helix domain-containing protein [Lachnospiraceae bacterium]|nr:helix-turn-helix domain-containing protein [Lachnospiraceae bacterium]